MPDLSIGVMWKCYMSIMQQNEVWMMESFSGTLAVATEATLLSVSM